VDIAERRSPRFGYVLVGVAAALWAASGTVAKLLFQDGLSPLDLVQLRTTVAAGVLVAWLIVIRRPGLRIRREDVVHFVLLGAVLGMTQFTYLFAISKIPVAAAILLQYQAPVLVALYALLFSAQKMTSLIAASLVSAVLGCYLMVGGYQMDMSGMNVQGVASGLVSAVGFAAYSVRSEQGMRTYEPMTVVCYAMVFAALFWNALQPPLGAFLENHTLQVWMGILFVGVLGTVLPFGLYSAGIRIIGATRASITATLEPVTAGFIAYLLLGEVMETLQILGGMLVMVSVALLQSRGKTVGSA
jgi:drug/metabolite transporter (DMT)-like permease